MNKTIQNEAEMTLFAQEIAENITKGDCFTLSGELGAGKSFLARAMMRALGVQDEALPSPTFAIIQEYEAASGMMIAHMDWYRLGNQDDVESLGINDFFQQPWVTLIEWSERAPELLPTHTRIHIRLDASNRHMRHVSIAKNT